MIPENPGFKARAATAAKDPSVAARFKMVADRHGALRRFRMAELGNFEEHRDRLSAIKDAVLDNHEALIARLKEQVEALGGKVHRAADAAAARRIITGIAREANVKIVVKGKSMTSEEVALTPALEEIGVEVFETDLGEYIIQLAKERPSHIVIPAIHKTKAEIAALFAEKLGMELTDDPTKLTMKAREVLREKFLAADLGITGANALVAENGTVVLVENEGNIRLSTTQPRIHVALAGIEKIVPAMIDLAALLKLLPRSATGQKLSGYVSMIRGPARPDERDGPREFHLVLLDNGRSRMRQDPVLRQALKCVRCGVCANICPVYQSIGGHAYGSVYPGPIGAMITQALATGDEGWLLPFASSLCGACDEVCPAKIPIHQILIELRRRAVEGAKPEVSAAGVGEPWQKSVAENAGFRVWSEFWSRPAGYKLFAGAAAMFGKIFPGKPMLTKLPPPGSAWTQDRDFPAPAAEPFRKRWPGIKSVARQAQPNINIPNEKLQPAPALQPESGKPAAMTPRPGDPAKLIADINMMQGKAVVAQGLAEAKAQLAEFLAPFAGGRLVKWDHPDLDLLGLDQIAEAAGIKIAPLDNLAKEEFKATVSQAALGVTAADFGIADSGTIALLTAPGHERSLSVLPPAHIAVLRAGKVLQSIDDLMIALQSEGPEIFRGLTLISGPSMTGDIEMLPVFGVHGPGKLFVIVWSE